MKGKSALQTLGFCSVVTVIIAAVLIFTDPRNWQMYLLESFVFSMAIGYSISYEMSLLTPWLSKMAMLVRLPLMFLMFLVGGTIGTLAGSIILVLVFGGQMYPWASILLFNLVLAAIFGSIAVIYFSLRGAAEKMAERLREKEIAEEKLEKLRAQAASLISAGRSRSVVELELAEGKNREVRRLFESQGLAIKRLQRIQIGKIKLGELKPGRWRALTETEIKTLLAEI